MNIFAFLEIPFIMKTFQSSIAHSDIISTSQMHYSITKDDYKNLAEMERLHFVFIFNFYFQVLKLAFMFCWMVKRINIKNHFNDFINILSMLNSIYEIYFPILTKLIWR